MTTGRGRVPDPVPHRPRGNRPGPRDHGQPGGTGQEHIDLGEIQRTELILGALAARGMDGQAAAGSAPDPVAGFAAPSGAADPALALLAALAADVELDPPGGSWLARPRPGTPHRLPARKAGTGRRMRAVIAVSVAAALLTTAVMMADAGVPGPVAWLAGVVRQAAGAGATAAAPPARPPGHAGPHVRAAQVPPVAFPGVWMVPATVGGASGGPLPGRDR